MLRISKLSDYAILIMVSMNEYPRRIASAHALSELAHVELPTTSKILKLLAKAGLVKSFRGPSGGYQLAREAGSINVAEIISAIEGPIAMTECSVEPGLCEQEDSCGLRSNWQRISMAVAGALRQLSLLEMAQPLPKTGIASLQITTLNG